MTDFLDWHPSSHNSQRLYERRTLFIEQILLNPRKAFEQLESEWNFGKVSEVWDDFVFDNQMLAQIAYADYEMAEVTCPTKYFEEASSINFKRSSIYGLGVLWTSTSFFLQRSPVAPKITKRLVSGSVSVILV